MERPRRGALTLTFFLLLAGVAGASDDAAPATFDDATKDLERRAGLFDLWIDDAAGRVLIEVPPARGEAGEAAVFLYAEGLATGLGSNPVGLDRGQLGPTRLVAMRHVGGKVLFEQRNLAYRAETEDRLERRAVAESFATSVLWAGEVVARRDDGTALVDLTPFLVRDAHDVASRLRSAGQGEFALDPERSAVDLPRCLAFPDNLELDVVLTYAGGDPGGHVRQVTPTPSAVTLVQHHSLIRLPDDGYRPREFDPRAGSFSVDFQDYAVPLDAPIERKWIVRHRLEKTHPGRERSRVKEPLVYYVDPGTPEPVRSALIDGAEWWAEAFEKAGFIDAYRVELLPEDVHPLDVRYNVIQWVHRSTRGWSYGGGVIDPRTGEMIKGHVRLGSLRVRQDRLLFEGLAGVDRTGTGAADDPVELALARIRQLSAHEVAHTLGLAHNFAASTYGRASVLDYPAPLVRLGADGKLDFSEAYDVGVGEWDVHAVRYAYSQFPDGADETRELERIVRDGLERGLVYLTDADARPAGAAHPLANLWDNGDDPVDELVRLLEVRRHALDRFGEGNIAPGRPLALLEEVLATLYLSHRYQLAAAGKVVGGMEYRYAMRGDGQPPARPIDAARQRRALDVLLGALSVETLDVPESILATLPPRPSGHGRTRESFASGTRPAFDSLEAAATAADLVVRELLQPERCARLVDFHRRDSTSPGLDEVVGALVQRTFEPFTVPAARGAAVRREVQRVVVFRMIALSADGAAPVRVRSVVDRHLARLHGVLSVFPEGDPSTEAHAAFLAREIQRYLERPETFDAGDLAAAGPPPGSPIGFRDGCSASTGPDPHGESAAVRSP